MQSDDIEGYLKAMDIIQARESLSAMGVADWPWKEGSSRESVIRDLHSKAYPEAEDKTPTVSMDEAMRMFNGK